jgi:glycosyltransferase involved in cell wall biosynthesis
MPRRPKILFVQSTLRPHGGGYAVAAWTLQALKPDFDVTLLTWGPVDFGALNEKFGTSLSGSDFPVIVPRPAARRIIEAIPDDWNIQKFSYLLAIAKRIGSSFDTAITAEMEADFGRPGIQYINYPYLQTAFERLRSSSDSPRGSRFRRLLNGSIRPWMMVSRYSFDRMRENLTLVNSDWGGGAYESAYGRKTVTLYPPAAGKFVTTPWEAREDGFVCIGRFHPQKRTDWVIETLARVHSRFPNVHLHIVGGAGQFPGEREFYPLLASLARRHSSWVHLHENISRDELMHLLARQRYGIHAMENEHFGMGIAEMVRAGCITFVHASGGQVEIVASEPALLYRTAEDAVARIEAILGKPQLQSELCRSLGERAHLFSPESFAAGLLRVVWQFLERGEQVAGHC